MAAALRPAARLPPVRADCDELEDVRWFPAAWLRAALSGEPVLLDRQPLDASYLDGAHAGGKIRAACLPVLRRGAERGGLQDRTA